VPGTGATPAVAAPHPGLATDPATWIAQFEFMNRDQAAWQQAEWKFLRAGVRAIRDYIDRVVLPAIRRAEQLLGARRSLG